MQRRPALATLGSLGVLGSLAGAGSTGPAALAGGDPGGAPPAPPGPDWEPTGLTEAARRVVLAGQTLYAVTVPGGMASGRGAATALWRGDPAGGPWAPLAAPAPRVADLAAHPDDPRLLYVAGDGGVHRSLDAGATWERVVVPLPSVRTPAHAGVRVVVSPADPALLYATTGAFSDATIWRSQDGGAGWEALRSFLATLCTWQFPVIAPDPAVRQRVYLSYSCAAGRTFSASLSVSDDLWATDGDILLRPTLTPGAPLSYLFPAAAAFDPAGQPKGPQRLRHPAGPALWTALRAGWPRVRPGPPVLVHRDYHPSNTVWLRGRLAGVVDWDDAARGAPGYDLAMCRVELALLSGPEAAAAFLRTYEAAAGRPEADVAFWDLYRAWWTLPDPERWLPGLHRLGRTDLTAALLRARLDAFIGDALARAT